MLDLKAKEVSQEAALTSLKVLWDNQEVCAYMALRNILNILSKDCVQDILSNFNGIIEDLAHRRAEQINEASAMCTSSATRTCCGSRACAHWSVPPPVEAHVSEREKSRRKLLAQASACIEENMENQKVRRLCEYYCARAFAYTSLQIATDADNLIKHYKALLRS